MTLWSLHKYSAERAFRSLSAHHLYSNTVQYSSTAWPLNRRSQVLSRLNPTHSRLDFLSLLTSYLPYCAFFLFLFFFFSFGDKRLDNTVADFDLDFRFFISLSLSHFFFFVMMMMGFTANRVLPLAYGVMGLGSSLLAWVSGGRGKVLYSSSAVPCHRRRRNKKRASRFQKQTPILCLGMLSTNPHTIKQAVCFVGCSGGGPLARGSRGIR